jgi:tetratricopeptide (TPR) repeat protein
MEKEFEFKAKKAYSNKQYQECLKLCFRCLSVNPSLLWIYDLMGYSYMNLNRHSQSRASFSVAKDLENNVSKINNYDKLIQLLYEQEQQKSN